MAEVKHANIYEAMAAAYEECGYVQKRRAQDLNYTFAGERAIIDEIRPAMVRHGIFVFPTNIREITRDTYQTSRGSTMNLVGVLVTYRFAHESGTEITVEAYGEGADVGDKAAPKALTGAYKYALRQAFCIETGDDPDNESSVGQERQSPRDTPPPARTPQQRPQNAPQSTLPPAPSVNPDMISALLGEIGIRDAAEKADNIGWAVDWNPVELTTKAKVAQAVGAWAIREGIMEDVEMKLVDRIKGRKGEAS